MRAKTVLAVSALFAVVLAVAVLASSVLAASDSAEPSGALLPRGNDQGTGRTSGSGLPADSGNGGLAAGMLIGIIRLYQRAISPWLPDCCRFEPTCSHYAIEALRVHGALRGSLLTVWRLLRCQPFCRGGFDPVPPPRRRKRPADAPESHRP